MGRASHSKQKSGEEGSGASEEVGSKKLTLPEIRNHHLLKRCDVGSDYPSGTLIWAKDTSYGYWPACVVPNPEPDEQETPMDPAEEEDKKNFAFLMYIEPQFRVGLVRWSNVIPVNISEASEQMELVMQLNRYERKRKSSRGVYDGWLMMKELFEVEPTHRQVRMQEKYKEFEVERKKKKAEMQEKAAAEPKPSPPPASAPDVPKTPIQRACSKFSLRPVVVVPKKWDYAEATAEVSRDLETSSTSTTSSKKVGKFSRPKDMDGERLKDWITERFDTMDKQLKFDSKEYVICSSLECGGELKDKEQIAHCHAFPFHKSCLKEIKVTNDTETLSKYKCEDCMDKRCFICKKENGVDEEPPPKCSKCDLRFHRDCLIFKWPQADVVGSTGPITCPLHFCHVCKAEHFHFDKVRDYHLPMSKAVKCIHCLAAYHKGTCIPAGTGNSLMQGQFIVCPRHVTEESLPVKKKRLGCFGCSKKVSPKDSVVSCSLCPLTFHASCVHGENHLKAGISLEEYRAAFKCEGCHWGTFPIYGQVVWYQQPGSSYWPSIILYPRDAAARGAIGSGQFSVGYCGSAQYYDNGRSAYTVPLEIGTKDFLKKLNFYSNNKVASAAKEAYHLIKLSEDRRDKSLPEPVPIYKKIDKNLYRIPVSLVSLKSKANGKRSSGKRASNDNNEICLCDAVEGTGPVCNLDTGCFNRVASIECNANNCSGGERCQNKMFSTEKTGQNEDLFEYFVCQGTKGWGLRTKCAFPEGAFLSEYVGEIISKEEVSWRVERKCDDDPLYILEISTSVYIDAEYFGNMSRLINHSCEPNCRTEKYFSALGKPVVGIFASREIHAGEELTFDYNYDAKSTLALKCRCKSEACKGFIGGARGNEENLIPNGKKAGKRGVGVSSDWKWEDECATCGCRGELLMCDHEGCSKAYHLVCLGLRTTPSGDWICPNHETDSMKETGTKTKPPPPKKSKLSHRV